MNWWNKKKNFLENIHIDQLITVEYDGPSALLMAAIESIAVGVDPSFKSTL